MLNSGIFTLQQQGIELVETGGGDFFGSGKYNVSFFILLATGRDQVIYWVTGSVHI